MRLTISLAEPLIHEQGTTLLEDACAPDLSVLVDRLGETRIYRVEPVESDVPERSVRRVPPLATPSGRTAIGLERETALLGRDLDANDGREDYLRARLEERADGALIATAVNQLERGGKSRALCTMCIGVGQGIAMLIERCA